MSGINRFSVRKKRILIVSPFFPCPAFEGNRRRVATLARAFKALGHEVHIAAVAAPDLDPGSETQTEKTLSVQAHGVGQYLATNKFRRIKRRIRRKLVSPLLRFMFRAPRWELAESDIDYIFDRDWHLGLYLLQQKYRFDAVCVEYVFLSQAFANFGPEVIKIIDTHDIFADRNDKLRANGVTHGWWTATAAAEIVGLSRADSVIGIQEEESEYFRANIPSRVVTIGHLFDSIAIDAQPGEGSVPSMLFVGFNNSPNVEALNWLMREVLPIVWRTLPLAELWVVGSVGEAIDVADARIRRLGRVTDLGPYYRQSHLVLNAVGFGTGLAIKTMEAMAQGKALVVRAAGARGLPLVAKQSVRVADSAPLFAHAVVELLASPIARLRMGEDCLGIVKEMNESQMCTLANLLHPVETMSPEWEASAR